jgi:acetyltransferase-like isoleucine patch superfamily enzyme
MSSNELTIGEGCMIGAYSYFLSGGEYDYRSPVKFCEQTGMQTRGPLHIGDNCWLGAHVTVVDGASIGNHCVIGAGAVVTQPLPPDSLAFGIPACVVKNIS